LRRYSNVKEEGSRQRFILYTSPAYMKKPVLLFTTLAALFLFLNSCCKSYCIGSGLYVKFIHYNAAEIDTLLLTGYAANGQFNQLQDSMYSYIHTSSADTMYVTVSENFSTTKDWKIKVVSTGKEYRLWGITTRKERCPCSNERVDVINGYTVDGVAKGSDFIELVK